MKKLRSALWASVVNLLIITQAMAQNPPTVSLQSVLDYDLFPTGMIRVENTDLIFAPPGSPDANVTIRTNDSASVASWDFSDSYINTTAVFARLRASGSAMHTLSVGDYSMDYSVGGNIITSIPFSVQQHSTSDDPFNPSSTLKFVGPWQNWAYITGRSPNDPDGTAYVHFWAGSSDLPEGQRRAGFIIKLFRDGALIAQSNPRTGNISNKIMNPHSAFLQEPHEADKSHLAKNVPLSELRKSGNYKVEIQLVETGDTIRSFAFSAADGKFVPHPRTNLGYQPATEYMAPRAYARGFGGYEFMEVHWIEAAP